MARAKGWLLFFVACESLQFGQLVFVVELSVPLKGLSPEAGARNGLNNEA